MIVEDSAVLGVVTGDAPVFVAPVLLVTGAAGPMKVVGSIRGGWGG